MSSSDHNFEAYEPNTNGSSSIEYSMRGETFWNNANESELINGISSDTAANIDANTSSNDDFVLESMFANTLLSDNFSKETVDCLGFESLDLNLIEPSITSTSAITSSINHSAQNKMSRPIECSLNFLNSQPDTNPSLVTLSTVNLSADLSISEHFPSVPNQNSMSVGIHHQQEQSQELNSLIPSKILNLNENEERETINDSSNLNSVLSNDEELFKKPFNKPRNDYVNLIDVDFNSISTTASSTSSIQSVNIPNFHSQHHHHHHLTGLNHLNILSNENVLKLKLLNSTSLISSSSSNSLNEFTRNQFNETDSTKSAKKSPNIESKKSNILVDDCKFVVNHGHANKIPLKRSRQTKKSKLLKNSAVLSVNQPPQEHKHVNRSDDFVLLNKQLNMFKQTKSNLNSKVKKIEKKEKASNKKGKKLNHFEPSSKKLAIDLKHDEKSSDPFVNKRNFIAANSGDSFITRSSCANAYNEHNSRAANNMNSKLNPFKAQLETPPSTSTEFGSFSNHNMRKNQKDKEVDLQIKELSLLNLCSSEDDSIDSRLKKESKGLTNDVMSKLIKKNTRSCSSEQTRIVHSPPQYKNAGLKLNELFSKRIKYSPTKPSSPIALQHELSKEDSKHSAFYMNDDLDRESGCLCSSSLPVSGSEAEKTISINLENRKKNQMTVVKLNEYSNVQTKRQKNDNNLEGTSECNENKLFVSQTKALRDEEQSKNDQFIFISVSPTTSPSSSSISNTHSTFMNTKSEANLGNDELSKSFSFENETITNMKNLDINNDIKEYNSQDNVQETHSCPNDTCIPATSTSQMANKMLKSAPYNTNQANSSSKSSTCDINFKLNLKDSNSRSYLWNLLKTHCTLDELISQFGAILHDKISLWDLVQLKLKFSQKSQIKTTYEIIEDYTVLYSNVSNLLERIVEEHSSENLSLSNRKSENSSRSRSSSRSFSRNNRKSNNSIK